MDIDNGHLILKNAVLFELDLMSKLLSVHCFELLYFSIVYFVVLSCVSVGVCFGVRARKIQCTGVVWNVQFLVRSRFSFVLDHMMSLNADKFYKCDGAGLFVFFVMSHICCFPIIFLKCFRITQIYKHNVADSHHDVWGIVSNLSRTCLLCQFVLLDVDSSEIFQVCLHNIMEKNLGQCVKLPN